MAHEKYEPEPVLGDYRLAKNIRDQLVLQRWDGSQWKTLPTWDLHRQEAI